MAVRDVKPFDEKQWAELMANMKRGQTPEQAKIIAEGKEFFKKVRKENF